MADTTGRSITDSGDVINIADTIGGVAVSSRYTGLKGYSPRTGRMLDEEGIAHNLADIIGGPVVATGLNIKSYAPFSGNYIKEDGSVVNITKNLITLLSGGGTGGGGTEPDEPETGGDEPADNPTSFGSWTNSNIAHLMQYRHGDSYMAAVLNDVLAYIANGGDISNMDYFYADNAGMTQADIDAIFANAFNLTETSSAMYAFSTMNVTEDVVLDPDKIFPNLPIKSNYAFQYTTMNSDGHTMQFEKPLNWCLDNAINMFAYCRGLIGTVDFAGGATYGCATNIFQYCRKLENVLNLPLDASVNGASSKNKQDFGFTKAEPGALKRFTVRYDTTLTNTYGATYDIAYAAMSADNVIEFFNSLPTITAGQNNTYKTITLTGNPCDTDGTLTDEIIAMASAKGFIVTV